MNERSILFFFCLVSVKSDKQLLSNDLGSKVAWSSSAFLGPNLWDKDQLYSAPGLHNEKSLSTTTTLTSSTGQVATNTSTVNNVSTGSSSTGNQSNGNNFKVENIEIDEFLCENNLNLNEIDTFSNPFDHVEQTRSNSPNNSGPDGLLLHSPMQAAPAKSPLDDSMSSFSIVFVLAMRLKYRLLSCLSFSLNRSTIVKLVEKVFSRRKPEQKRSQQANEEVSKGEFDSWIKLRSTVEFVQG